MSHSLVAFPGNFSSRTSASDLLKGWSDNVSGVPLKALGRGRLGTRRRDFSIFAKIKKGKKLDHPWPENPDLNVQGGVLSHLSHFKPLREKPKPVILEFEKPLIELNKKIIDVKKMANETGLDFSDQIMALEMKYQKALKYLYTNLAPIQRVHIARHPNRPTFLDHVFSMTDKFVELHGDRCGYDDPAIVTGLGMIEGRRFMFIGHQKGRNTKEHIKRNFGMPTPHGYRKALRLMKYADHHGFPIVTFVDTPGAFSDLKSEELGQGEAIAHNLREMFGLKVPIISIIIGEGGSGGALAIACANKMLMLENSVFYVASPEACAAILWKSAKAAPKAAKKLKITATELCKMQIADGVIREPLGGAHADPHWTSQQIKAAILETMDELEQMNTEELLEHRRLKYRKIGSFEESVPLDPVKKRNMKKKPKRALVSENELAAEVEKLREHITKSRDPLKEIHETCEEVLNLSELKQKIEELEAEIAKSGNPSTVSQMKVKLGELFEENQKKIKNVIESSDMKKKMELLKVELEKDGKAPNSESKNRIQALEQQIKKEIREAAESKDIKEKYNKLVQEVVEASRGQIRV